MEERLWEMFTLRFLLIEERAVEFKNYEAFYPLLLTYPYSSGGNLNPLLYGDFDAFFKPVVAIFLLPALAI
jgi:hypothetical protein